MAAATPPETIYVLLPRVAALVGSVAKERHRSTDGDGLKYPYRSIEHIVDEVHGLFAAHGVTMVPEYSIHSITTIPRFDRKTGAAYGETTHVWLIGKFRFYAPDGSFVEATTIGEAADVSDKATNKAMTAALKYALTETLLIPFSELDDSDADQAPIERNDPPPRPPAQRPDAMVPVVEEDEEATTAAELIRERVTAIRPKWTARKKATGEDTAIAVIKLAHDAGEISMVQAEAAGWGSGSIVLSDIEANLVWFEEWLK